MDRSWHEPRTPKSIALAAAASQFDRDASSMVMTTVLVRQVCASGDDGGKHEHWAKVRLPDPVM